MNIKIGLIDSGVYPHKDLRNIGSGYNYIDNNEFTQLDSTGHGTNIAGILSLLPYVEIIPLKTVTKSKYNIDNFAKAIEFCRENEIKIINFSYSFKFFTDKFFNSIKNYDGIIICSAGNNSSDIDKNKLYPPYFRFKNIIVVNSIDSENNLSSFSNYGKKIHLSYYGENIKTTDIHNRYKVCSGTSFSVPFVTLCAAAVLRENTETGEIRKILIDSGIKNDKLKTPILNFKKFVKL